MLRVGQNSPQSAVRRNRNISPQHYIENHAMGSALHCTFVINGKQAPQLRVPSLCMGLVRGKQVSLKPHLARSDAATPALFLCLPRLPESESQKANNRVVFK